MLFIRSLLVAASALVTLAAAQSKVIKFTSVPNIVKAGTAYPIKWETTDSTTPITIKLRVGGFNDLQDVSVLTTDASGGVYTWTPDKGLGDNSYYALEIIQGKEINYSAQITLNGGSTSSLIPTASASSAAASASSASSASESSASASSASASSASATGTTLSTATITDSSSSASATAASKTASKSGSLTAATTKTTGTASPTESSISAPTSTGAADRIIMGSSPLALIFGAVAAMIYLN